MHLAEESNLGSLNQMETEWLVQFHLSSEIRIKQTYG